MLSLVILADLQLSQYVPCFLWSFYLLSYFPVASLFRLIFCRCFIGRFHVFSAVFAWWCYQCYLSCFNVFSLVSNLLYGPLYFLIYFRASSLISCLLKCAFTLLSFHIAVFSCLLQCFLDAFMLAFVLFSFSFSYMFLRFHYYLSCFTAFFVILF